MVGQYELRPLRKMDTFKMANHQVADVDPQALKNAEKMWHNFTIFGKYAILGTCVILIGLAAAFVQF